jgi:hypothetical protein
MPIAAARPHGKPWSAYRQPWQQSRSRSSRRAAHWRPSGAHLMVLSMLIGRKLEREMT